MRHRVLLPSEASEAVPRGAALLEVRRGVGLVFNSRESFAERCAQALLEGRRVAIPAGCVEVGYYDAADGELRGHHQGILALERWLGRRVSRGDLEARENRTERRRRARSLYIQGRHREAAALDRRMGW